MVGIFLMKMKDIEHLFLRMKLDNSWSYAHDGNKQHQTLNLKTKGIIALSSHLFTFCHFCAFLAAGVIRWNGNR